MWRKNPKENMPRTYYFVAVGSFIFALSVAMLAFGKTGTSAFVIAVTFGLLTMFFGIPNVLSHIHDFRRRVTRHPYGEVETRTGTMPPRAARVEMLLPVFGIAVGMLLIAGVFVFD